MIKIYHKLLYSITTLALVSAFFATTSFGQIDRIAKGRAKDMLKNVVNQIEKNYHDPNFKGIDLKAKRKEAEKEIDKATSLGQAFGIIAQLLLNFDDSHLTFYPPSRPAKIEYGWRMKMIGDKCFVVAVKPKSDAHKKGLKAGDQIIAVNGFRPTRKEMWKMEYFYYILNPQTRLKLAVASPGGAPRQLVINTKITKLNRIIDLTSSTGFSEYLRDLNSDNEGSYHRFFSIGGVSIWRMPTFSFDPQRVSEFMNDQIKKNQKLILDLRGNGGGSVKTLKEIVGFVFDKDVKIADTKMRDKTEEVIAKSKTNESFTGKIIVLIDSDSGSASEAFARLMQIENRGIVVGDQSAGAVMQSTFYNAQMGVNRLVFYGASITNADVIMTDGKSLEHVGVTPDEVVLKSGKDLAYEKDPVMSRALKIFGVSSKPETTGKMFPTVWADGKKGNVSALNP